MESFAATAEAARRAGQPDEALRIARDGLEHAPDATASRIAAALALLDLGRADEARCELEQLVEPAAPPATESVDGGLGALDDGEIDAAFDSAEPETSAMLDADEVAQQAMRAADLDEPEGAFSVDEALADADAIPPDDSPFHTQTMADLLESQGDVPGAERIRAALDAIPPARPAALDTLEQWLQNLRRGTA